MGRKSFFRQPSFVLPVLISLTAFACAKPQIQFSGVYNGDNYTNVVQVDTFSVKLSTVFLDSFITSGTSAQLIGRYIDPYFGVITSQSFTQFAPPLPVPLLSIYSTYDSIVLIERINRTFYGDTTKFQRFEVSQLTQTMIPPPNQVAFYNNNSIPYDPTVLGSADVLIRPTAGLTTLGNGDSVLIRMPDSMGEDLFGLIFRNSDTVTNDAIFQNYFKGLTVYPDTTLPGAIYGFRDSAVLRIYYHEPGVTTVYKTIDFPVLYPITQFNHIPYDRTGTPTAPLNALNPELQSTASGNQAYLQPITSLYVKLLFPTISNLQGYQDYLAVMKAELIIKPVAATYSPLYALPPLLPMSLTNSSNTIGATLPYGTGNLMIDYLYGTNTSYSYDITSYIQGALNQGAPNNAINGLILFTPAASANTTFNRAVLGNQFSPLQSNQVSLQIFYASYY
jgi:hypothetical protein